LNYRIYPAVPVVSIEVSDSAVLVLTLLSGGRVLDRFANGRMPIYLFTSEDEAAPFRGAPATWCSVLGLSSRRELETAFEQRLWVPDILARFSKALGLNPDIAACGYFVSFDGDPVPYDEYLDARVQEAAGFEEQHYMRTGGAE